MEKKSLSKKGLSGVITAVLMIALVMAAVVIVWGVVNRTIKNQIEGSEACFGNYNKVTINSIYTCYESVGVGDYNVHFSLNIGDIDVDEVVVSISAEGSTQSYTLNNSLKTISGLGPYPSDTGDVELPAKNAGLTYIASGFSQTPDLIKIAPVIKGEQCEISDTVSNIDFCY